MKLNLWSESVELYNAFRASGKFEVSTISSFDPAMEVAITVVDGSYVELTALDTAVSKVFYILPANAMRFDLQQVKIQYPNVIFLPPRLTLHQVCEEVILQSHSNMAAPDRHIHVFFGADDKVGTTMVAQSVAEELAATSDAKIGLLLLGKNPVQYMDMAEGIYGLESIKIKLLNNILGKEDLLKASVPTKLKNLSVLPGPSYIQDRRLYHPQHAETLLQIAGNCFDVVLVDAGCDVERGLSLGAVRMAKSKMLVTTQQQNAGEEFLRVNDQVFTPLHIEKHHFYCVLNKYVDGAISEKQIAQVYGMQVIAKLPNLELKGWQAEIDRKSLLHYGDAGYGRAVSKIVQAIADSQRISLREAKKGMFSKWMQ